MFFLTPSYTVGMVHVSVLIFVVFFTRATQAVSQDSEGNGNELTGATAILVSVGLVGTGVLFVAICTWTWFRRQYRKLCPLAPPEDDDIPEALRPPDSPEFPRSSPPRGPTMTLDPGNLRRDHRIEFEPIPSLDALVSATTRFYVNENGDARLSFDSLQNFPATPSIILAAEDEGIYAHDWFTNATLKFPRSEVTFIQEVGSGWFGLVVESEAKDIVPYPPRCRVWVKYLREEATNHEQMKFLDESRVYRDSNHKNILKLLGHCIEATPYLLIFEHYPKGDLKTYLNEHSRDSSSIDSQGATIRTKMILDVAHGLDWMHQNNYIHRDLAARNCLVGDKGQIVIGDYGLSTQRFKKDYYWSSNIAIPIRWMAPESLECAPTAIKTLKTTKEANIWSFGVLIWEICELGKFPYAELSDEQVLSRVIADKNYNLKQPSITSFPYVTLRTKLANIQLTCFHPLPDKRPTVSSLVDSLSVPGGPSVDIVSIV